MGRLDAPLRALLAAALLAAPALAQSDYARYAAQCVADVGDIPEIHCDQGIEIPITQNGAPPPAYTPGMLCDRPSLLNNGAGSDGQCVPGSRILNLSEGPKQISVMCRQKKIRLDTPLRFDEIDVIAHNSQTGATCWFQASAPAGGTLPGTDVPSPTSAAGAAFFKEPHLVVEDGCGRCHDNDPFMYSPFIGQVWGHVPQNPLGPYAHVNVAGLLFDTWPTTQMLPRDSTCTSCHRIGINETCGELTDWATGRTVPLGANALAQTYPLSHSMQPFHGQTLMAWAEINDVAVDRITSCCADRNQPQCQLSDILNYVE
jgi:hypothetical protein